MSERLDTLTDLLVIGFLGLAALMTDDQAARAAYIVGILLFTRTGAER